MYRTDTSEHHQPTPPHTHEEVRLMASKDVSRRGAFGVDRETAAEMAQVRGQVRKAAMEVDGAYALAAHIAEGAAQFLAHRRAVEANGPELQMFLAPVTGTVVRQIGSIQ